MSLSNVVAPTLLLFVLCFSSICYDTMYIPVQVKLLILSVFFVREGFGMLHSIDEERWCCSRCRYLMFIVYLVHLIFFKLLPHIASIDVRSVLACCAGSNNKSSNTSSFHLVLCSYCVYFCSFWWSAWLHVARLRYDVGCYRRVCPWSVHIRRTVYIFSTFVR